MTSPIVSTDVRVAIAPVATYRGVADAPDGRWLVVIQRPALVALVIGLLVPIAATGRVTPVDAALAMATWWWVPALQLLVGWVVTASLPERRVTLARALELYSAGHVPWTLWLLGAALIASSGISFLGALAIASSAVVPLIWTAFITRAFVRVVLNASPSETRSRLALQHALLWTTVVAFAVFAGGLLPRIMGDW